ncbi:MAG: heme exporter protein CcmD [Azospirillaceae bacterium]|nr:heme exporter protein CcmD [Azospirillaceae bacterium]
MSEFLEMGGYAAFVWPAYGIVIVVLAGLLLVSLHRLRRNDAILTGLEAAHPRRRRNATAVSEPAPPSAPEIAGTDR